MCYFVSEKDANFHDVKYRIHMTVGMFYSHGLRIEIRISMLSEGGFDQRMLEFT